MDLPDNLKQAIEKELQQFHFQEVKQAREQLTDRYRQPSLHTQFMETQTQRNAYIAARLPATYAVIHRVLEEVDSRAIAPSPKSLLDLGAGPGSVMWAASDVFPHLQHITLIEKDASLAELGKRLAQHNPLTAVRQAQWSIQDLEQVRSFPSHDLVVLSYSIGELTPATIEPLIEACFKSTNQLLVVIEPGTPAGFERIRLIRDYLIRLKAYIIAPCPHMLKCPMAGGDWCHFSERVNRSSLHRRIKEGSLSYEDEKFSYVAFSKTPSPLPESQVLRHPLKRSGHISLTLCTPEGLKQEIISKKQGKVYKQAKKLEWGSSFNRDK